MINEYLNKIKTLEREYRNFCLSKYLDKEKISNELKTNLEKVLKKNVYSEYSEIKFYSHIQIISEKIDFVTFSINFGYSLDIFKMEFTTSYTNNKIKLPKIKNFLTNSNNVKINTKNEYLIAINNCLSNIEKEIQSKVNDMLDENNQDFIYLNNINNEIKKITTEFNKKVFFDKVDNNKLKKLINEVVDINLEDFNIKFYVSENYIKNDEYIFSIYLFPHDLLKYDSVNILRINYNTINKSFKINKKIINSNILKKNIDVNKNMKKLNSYIIGVLKS